MTSLAQTGSPESLQFANGRVQYPFARFCRTSALVFYIAILAWAPFPLGSDVAWGPPTLEIAIGACWILWAVSAAFEPEQILQTFRKVRAPAVLIVVVLSWIALQAFLGAPSALANPVWSIASQTLAHSVQAHVSINPLHTRLELLKLVFLIEAFWLALCFSSHLEAAKVLLASTVVITSAYALYAFFLILFHTSQASLLYSAEGFSRLVSGPFMLHNSFATFCGLGLLAAIVGFLRSTLRNIVAHRGAKRLLLSFLNSTFGAGVYWLTGVVVLLSALVASGSRGGFISALIGIAAMMLAAALQRPRNSRSVAVVAVTICIVVPLFLLLIFNASLLNDRFSELAQTGNADEIRIALWSATKRMISVFPYTGLGLGTFEDAYPMFAVRVFPYAMDKAHCDYLEFAAGVGIPAAAMWLLGMAALASTCFIGIRKRRRNWNFPLLGWGATALIAAHSFVDFSLQLPAVALLFSTIMGIGVAQSQSRSLSTL